MQLKVNLVITSGDGSGLQWPLGDSYVAPSTQLLSLPPEQAWLKTDAVLFWDAALGQPAPLVIRELLNGPADVYHSGLCFGLAGKPTILNSIQPTWMFNCDAEPHIDSTSWRVSLRACLVRTDVVKKLGFLRPGFVSREGAALEWGHRLITTGALLRNTARLLSGCGLQGGHATKPEIPFEDELRFTQYRFGAKWAAWALMRSVYTRRTNLLAAFRAWRTIRGTARTSLPSPYRPEQIQTKIAIERIPSVTVLVPTVDRYPYLRTLLEQLRPQTVKPLEIIVVDQTAPEKRQDLSTDFSDLPLRWMVQDQPGQCTSRNAGLRVAIGDCVLFIDDDDEIPDDLIEQHLRTLQEYCAEVSCGVANEVGAGPLPAEFSYVRSSDGFPTNNAMIRKEVLHRSGLFDLAYNRAQRADGDLGMRMYLAGANMILNPGIRVLHHHAPAGGLRKHKARTVTYAASRSSVFKRALCSASEIYFAHRYFGDVQAHEMTAMSLLGTFSMRGNVVCKMAKLIVSLVALPQSLILVNQRRKQARAMLDRFPDIPHLKSAEGVKRS